MSIVCVLTNKNIDKQISIVKKYKKHIYAIEIRVDTFYPKIEKIIHILEKIKKNLPEIKIILTFRKFSEGGKVRIAEDKRKEILIEILSEKHKLIDYIDIEFNSKIKKDLLLAVKKYKKTLIVSSHFIKKQIGIKKFVKIIRLMDKFLKQNEQKGIIKIVIKSDNFKHYFKFLKEIYRIKLKNLTFFATGKMSLLSRSINVLLKMPLIYIAILKPVISTQPNIKDFTKTLKKIGIIK